MKSKSLLALTLLVLCACSEEKSPYSSNGSFGQLSNTREFGVVLSQREREGVNTQGIVSVTGAASTNVAVGAASQNSFLSPFSSLFGSSSNNNTSTDAKAVTIEYVIQTDSGKKLTIDQMPVENEQILYPGQKVAVQSNGTYVRVYPADIENRLR